MKKILLIIFLFVLYFTVSANGASIDLPELLKPDSIFVNNGNLYIVEGDICRIYKLPKMKYS